MQVAALSIHTRATLKECSLWPSVPLPCVHLWPVACHPSHPFTDTLTNMLSLYTRPSYGTFYGTLYRKTLRFGLKGMIGFALMDTSWPEWTLIQC